MILEFLKHFNQNSVRNYCYLFFDQNSSLKRTFLKIMQPIGKVEKMSTEFFKNSDESGILMEFFKNFDQNTGGKL